jgi:hypothetical protein
MREGDVVLLYKKGDSRDPRNYRPITLLQVDYKILAKILVAWMEKKILDRKRYTLATTQKQIVQITFLPLPPQSPSRFLLQAAL